MKAIRYTRWGPPEVLELHDKEQPTPGPDEVLLQVHAPANVSFEAAASVGVVGLTALQAVRTRGQVQAGEQVLINGAGGGVGTCAVQIIAVQPEAVITGPAATRTVL
jgi:NADPH:quinone reductase-like Zn-dependent oxidoreductase